MMREVWICAAPTHDFVREIPIVFPCAQRRAFTYISPTLTCMTITDPTDHSHSRMVDHAALSFPLFDVNKCECFVSDLRVFGVCRSLRLMSAEGFFSMAGAGVSPGASVSELGTGGEPLHHRASVGQPQTPTSGSVPPVVTLQSPAVVTQSPSSSPGAGPGGSSVYRYKDPSPSPTSSFLYSRSHQTAGISLLCRKALSPNDGRSGRESSGDGTEMLMEAF